MTTDMTAVATKQDLVGLATKQDLAEHARLTKQDLADLADKMATKQDIVGLATKQDLASVEERMKLYFDAAVENFRADLDAIDTETIRTHSAEILQLQIHTGLRKA